MIKHGGFLVWLTLMPTAVLAEQAAPKQVEEQLCPQAGTQAEINACAAETEKKADAELNRVYQEILTRYKDDPNFLKKLRKAQRAWIEFRDAQFEARFPEILDARGQYNYGSVFPMCAALYKAQLTRQRIEELRLWLDGVEEGDVCTGSLPVKE